MIGIVLRSFFLPPLFCLPYSFIHNISPSEPTEDWTVQELLQWCLLKSHEALDNKTEELTSALNQQLEQGKKELWESHSIAVALENENPQTSADSKPAASKKASPGAITHILVHVMQGPHEGQSFKLQPKPRSPCWVGRSTGKKYRERGISFAKDEEVSTVHGKFELSKGVATFVDTGSTNGTFHGETELEAHVPFELKNDMELKMGSTVVKITLLRE